MKAFISLLVLVTVTTAHGRAIKPGDFAYGQDLQAATAAPFYQFIISDDLYRGATRTDLADVAIFNGRGDQVPFVLRPAEPEGTTNIMKDLPLFALTGELQKTAEGFAIQVTAEKEKAHVNVTPAGSTTAKANAYLLDATTISNNVVGLELQWEDGPDFLEKLKVEATDDLESWRTVLNEGTVAKLANQGSIFVRRTVEFPAITAKYFRLSFPEGAKVPRLVRVTAKLAKPGAQERRWLTVPADSGENAGEYIYNIPGTMPLDRLRLVFSEPNVVKAQFLIRKSDKDQWQYVGSGTMYRLRSGDGEIDSPDLSIYPVVARQLLLRVENGAALHDPPQLSVGWVPQRVIFVPSGEPPFYVAYGSRTAIVEGHRELLAVVEQRKGDVVEVAVGPQKVMGGEKLREESFVSDWKKILLWGVLVAGVGLLVWMSIRLHRQMEVDKQNRSEKP